VELQDWLDKDLEAAAARQRSRVDTAKLLATFIAGIAATLVATALQVGTPNTLDMMSAYFLAASVVAAIFVVISDRITEADSDLLLRIAQQEKWSDQELVGKLRRASMIAAENNKGVVAQVQSALSVQVALSIITGVIAAVSLLT
jgi:hypothetical protein